MGSAGSTIHGGAVGAGCHHRHRQVKVSPQVSPRNLSNNESDVGSGPVGDAVRFSGCVSPVTGEVSKKKRNRSPLIHVEASQPQRCCSREDSGAMSAKALKYEVDTDIAGEPNAKTADAALPVPQLTHEYWHRAKQNYWDAARNLPDGDPSIHTPRSELSSIGSSDSGDEYCIPGREESISCGLVLLRERPRFFSKTFIYVEHELKVKRTKLYLVPTRVEEHQNRRIKVRSIQVFRLSSIDKVVVKKEDQGYSTISLTLSPHCEHKQIVLAVDTTESEGALEWVDTLSTAVESEQIRAAQVKQNFRERLQQQNEAWQKEARRVSEPSVVAESIIIAQAWHARAKAKGIKPRNENENNGNVATQE